MSPRRHRMLVASFCMAALATFGLFTMVFLMATVNRGDRDAAAVLGLVVIFLAFLPSVIGTALGFSTVERHASTPISAWIATAWNGLIVGMFVLLYVIGMLMR